MVVTPSSRFRFFVIRYNMGILSSILLFASLIFYINAERIRAITKSDNPDAFVSGDIVTVKEAIDGDDLLIEKEGVLTNLRLLGIESFNPTVSDPLLSEYGQICFQYIKSRMEGKQARLEIPEKRTGSKGRLLGTLYVQDKTGEYTIDLGLELISKGYSLAYTRYHFKFMPQYLAAEQKAKNSHEGFWSNERIAARAISMRKLWEEEKLND